MPTNKVLQFAGYALFVVGALLATIGTTSTGLFVFYGALAVAGGLLVAYANKLRDSR